MDIRDKKVLLVGLGILGGGVATAKWLVDQGAILTITDMKDEIFLKPSIEKLSDFKNKLKFVLGEHHEKDFLENDIIIINPDVPIIDNKFLKLAKDNGKQIENELTLFYKNCQSKNIIAVTGTRGKTTTTNWIDFLLKKTNSDSLIAGNSPTEPLLEVIKNVKKDASIVIEEPSFLLEIFNESRLYPHIAIITNIYRDHINRHRSEENYALAKANIFTNQTQNDFLILNNENSWTEFLIKQKPKSKIFFFSKNNLLDSKRGVFTRDGKIILKVDKEQEIIPVENFVSKYGEHNLENFLAAILAVYLMFGKLPSDLFEEINNLPQIKFRQEKVFGNESLEIYNDSAATSPEAGIAAVERFNKEENFVLISGGTDRDLDFKKWAEVIKHNIKQNHLILLSGSATEKMKKGLENFEFDEFDSLKECFDRALMLAKNFGNKKTVIVFSPSAKSFEKFKNEFDRGEKFNILVKEGLCRS